MTQDFNSQCAARSTDQLKQLWGSLKKAWRVGKASQTTGTTAANPARNAAEVIGEVTCSNWHDLKDTQIERIMDGLEAKNSAPVLNSTSKGSALAAAKNKRDAMVKKHESKRQQTDDKENETAAQTLQTVQVRAPGRERRAPEPVTHRRCATSRRRVYKF